jgi:hypothetical protein
MGCRLLANAARGVMIVGLLRQIEDGSRRAGLPQLLKTNNEVVITKEKQ